MNTKEVLFTEAETAKLMACRNPDAGLLLMFIRCGNPAGDAPVNLGMSENRYLQALELLRQFGMVDTGPLQQAKLGYPPVYTDDEVNKALAPGEEFAMLADDVQRCLGRPLAIAELKTILSFVKHLGLPPEVISMLVCYCKELARKNGTMNSPSLMMIEKEAYCWADRGIRTMSAAAAYMQADRAQDARLAELKRILQLPNVSLSPTQMQFAKEWLGMGFDSEALSLAYDRTCINTGRLEWAYMNKILMNWHQRGIHTGTQVKNYDTNPRYNQRANWNGKANLTQPGLGQFEKEAIARMLREAEMGELA